MGKSRFIFSAAAYPSSTLPLCLRLGLSVLIPPSCLLREDGFLPQQLLVPSTVQVDPGGLDPDVVKAANHC